MARQSPPRSALSEPESFISETRLRRVLRRYGWAVWSAAAVGLVGIGALVLVLGRRPEPVMLAQKIDLPKTKAPPPAAPPAPLPSASPVSTTPAVPAAVKEEMLAPWRPAETRRVVEDGKPLPEQIADLPPPVPEAPAEIPAADPAGPISAPKPADATASVNAKPDVTPARDDASPRTEPSAANDEIKKADRYLSRGQFTIARYIYEEAYKAGDPRGALGLARSYDPAYLKSIGLRTGAHVQKSSIWYRRAAEMNARAPASPTAEGAAAATSPLRP